MDKVVDSRCKGKQYARVLPSEHNFIVRYIKYLNYMFRPL